MAKKRYILVEDDDSSAEAAAGCLLVIGVFAVLAFVAVVFLMALPYVAAFAVAVVSYSAINAVINENDRSGGAAALSLAIALIAAALSFYFVKGFSDNVLIGWGSKLPVDPNPSALQGYLLKAKYGNGSLISINSLSECSHSYDPLHGIFGIGKNRESYTCSKGSYVFKYNTGRVLECGLAQASIKDNGNDKYTYTLRSVEGTCRNVKAPS